MLYVCNVDEALGRDGNALTSAVAEAQRRGRGMRSVDLGRDRGGGGAAAAEAERASSSPRSGLAETGLNRVIRAGYELLDLITFFTAGPKEARAWTVHRGAPRRPQAAGVIHTDFEKGFIRAETIAYDDYVAPRRRSGRHATPASSALEGKDYVVQDGDVMHFRFNV